MKIMIADGHGKPFFLGPGPFGPEKGKLFLTRGTEGKRTMTVQFYGTVSVEDAKRIRDELDAWIKEQGR